MTSDIDIWQAGSSRSSLNVKVRGQSSVFFFSAMEMHVTTTRDDVFLVVRRFVLKWSVPPRVEAFCFLDRNTCTVTDRVEWSVGRAVASHPLVGVLTTLQGVLND